MKLKPISEIETNFRFQIHNLCNCQL